MKDLEAKEKAGVPKEGYANLTNHYMFKRIFGSEECKDILIRFLNDIMGDKVIEEVTFLPTEHLGPTEDDREAIFDISCKTKDEEFIVEMQNAHQTYFRDRALFYSCYPVINQAGLARKKHFEEYGNTISFRWNFRLKPVRFIALLNFRMKHDEIWPDDRCHSSYHIREDSTHEIMHDKLQFIFLELARFEKGEEELETAYDRWMFLFKNMVKLKTRPKVFDGKEYDRLFEMSKFSNFTAEEFDSYKNAEKMIWDYYNTIDTAAEEGREKGRAEGREEGLKEAAKGMKALGMSDEETSKATGLDVAVIQSLL